MPRLQPAPALLACCLALAACATEQQVVGDKEDMLAAAGFTIRPANTPERQASLRALPPNRLVRETKGDRVLYLYADPLVCACLYVGDQKAYSAYRLEAFQRRIADEQQLTAEMYNEQWDIGPWGPGWW